MVSIRNELKEVNGKVITKYVGPVSIRNELKAIVLIGGYMLLAWVSIRNELKDDATEAKSITTIIKYQ